MRISDRVSRDERAQTLAQLVDDEWDEWVDRARARLGGHAGDASDAVQDAAIQALNGLESLRDPAAIRSWFVTALDHLCIRRRRRRRWEAARFRPLEVVDELDSGAECGGGIPELASSVAEPLRAFAAQDAIERVRAEVAALDPILRDVAEKRWFEQKTVAQIARQLSITRASARRRLEEASAVLRQRLRSFARGLDR